VVTLTAAPARVWERVYARQLVMTDIVIVVGAVFGTQLAWFGANASELHIPREGMRDFTVGYWLISLVFSLLWLASLSISGTRGAKVVGSGTSEYRRTLEATLRVFGLIAIAMFLLKSELGRGYFLTALPIGLGLLLLGRWLSRRWLDRQRATGSFLTRALLVGDRTKTEHVIQNLVRDSSSGLAMVGAITPNGSAGSTLTHGVPVVGGFDDIVTAVVEYGADAVIFTGADALGPRQMRELGWSLDQLRVGVIVAPSLTDVAGPRIHAEPVAGQALIRIDYPTLEGSKHLWKRASDVMVAASAIVLLSPLFLVITIAVRRDSRGPAFFRQDRVGLNGEPFKMLKFRSMVVDAESRLDALQQDSDGNGVLFKLRDDPRVTRLGRLLRRYSLDELPQLVNVLRGEMSIVGPRPPLAHEVALYDEWAHRRLLVKPGITGLWQVSGRSDLSWADSVRLDLYYVENWSLTSDVVIMWRTARAVVRSAGAY
jgi:exopolysaccharide biosynthesis polyprenyl glycosylphosphotransferase